MNLPEEMDKVVTDVEEVFNNIQSVKGDLYASWLSSIYNLIICNTLITGAAAENSDKRLVLLLQPRIENVVTEIISKATDHISHHTGVPHQKVHVDFSSDILRLLQRAYSTGIYALIKGGSIETNGASSSGSGSSSG